MNKLDKLFNNSKRIKIDNNSKIVIMSDCHRGSGDNYDNFIKNQNIFNCALLHYYNNGFTYIELGDGDEMWEVNDYKDIILEHLDTFKILKMFNDKNRLIMLYGNHDINKKRSMEVFASYHDKITKKEEKLLYNLKVEESLILEYEDKELFLIHGHQVDFLNNALWPLSKFLVKHVWKKLEHIGIDDPTSAAKNYHETKRIEKKLKKWSIENQKIIITGHTHRPVFPTTNSMYFNDGSCIHPNGVTCLEIENGNITLVKWLFKLQNDKLISIGKEVVAGSESINNYYK